MKRIRNYIIKNWRLTLVNYIGGVGYYFLSLSLLLWMFGLFMRFQQYVLLWPVSPETQSQVAGSPSVVTTGNILTTIALYAFVLFMVLLTVMIAVSIPYYIGKFMSESFRGLFKMTDQPKTLSRLLNYKLLSSSVMIAVTVVTIYDYQLEVVDNELALILLLFSILSALFFWLQHLITRLWKFKFKVIF